MSAIEAPRLIRLRTADGVELAVQRLGDPGGTPIVLVPGTFSNATFWIGTRGRGLARTLADHGYDTWSVDPRGHGQSQRPDRGVRWRFDDWARYDVPAVVRAATDGGRSPIVIGHSAGGAATLAALGADPELHSLVHAAVIVATPLPWLQLGRGAMATTIRGLAARLDTFPARMFKLGPEDEPAGVLEQWFDWNLRGHWIGNDGTDYGACLHRVRVPLFMLAGAADRLWAPPRTCLGLYERIGSSRKSFMLCGRHTGFSHDYGHVDIIVSRFARTEVWPLITAWLHAHT